MRIAIARLRVWLALAGWQALDDDLRRLRDRIAPIRDLDVQLQHEPPPRRAAVLHRRHDRAQDALVATLEDPRVPSLLLALSYLPPLAVERATSMLPQMARRVLRRGRAAKRHGYDLESLHRLRCVVRRLRFALEWLEADAADLVKVQDALGEACDFGVALHNLGPRRGKRVKDYRASVGRDLRRAKKEARAVFHAVRPHLEELASGARDG